ncbi:adenosine deaminase [Paenibacillus turpanensis]|uniref:adenosine deaminase n=1 Tax=Paenibacillus turpanensis TaxID=2689078 RepID=UPI001408B04B|nr:adenosine deaminase [Paenibacillus turpanensis]
MVEQAELLRKLPKVDLHLHLDGSLRTETILDLAAQQGLPLPVNTLEELAPYVQVGEDCRSLSEYLSKFHFTTKFLQTEEALERAAYEIVEQSAEHNCGYIEVRFAPQLHREQGLSAEAAIQHVLNGLQRGEREFGVVSRAIAICMRNHSTKENIEVVEAASQFAGLGLAAVDLAGDEAAYPPHLFREVFARCGRKGLHVTIHAGEAGGADHIDEALHGLGASRIGHGVRLHENPALMNRVIERQVPLEMCPISNLQTKSVPDWDRYPIRDYFDKGIKVTVNTDNPGVSGTNITKEYGILCERFGFSIQELAMIAWNGLDAAFLDDSDKIQLKRKFREQVKCLGLTV